MRPYHIHLYHPILTGKSENRPEATTADAAGHLEETKIGARTGHGARMQASNGKRSAETRTITPEETAIQDYSEATKVITGHDQDPELRLHGDTLQHEMRAIEIEDENGMSSSQATKRRISGRRKRKRQHQQCRRNQ